MSNSWTVQDGKTMTATRPSMHKSKTVCAVKKKLNSEAGTEDIASHSGRIAPAVRAENYRLKSFTIVPYEQLNRNKEPPQRTTVEAEENECRTEFDQRKLKTIIRENSGG